MQKMVDMAHSAKDTEKEYGAKGAPAVPTPSVAPPKYPYGLALAMGKDELDKLGITELPEVGNSIHLVAMAKVTSVSSRETEDGCECRVELQITHLGCEGEDEEAEEAMPKRRSASASMKARYGGDEEEDEAA